MIMARILFDLRKFRVTNYPLLPSRGEAEHIDRYVESDGNVREANPVWWIYAYEWRQSSRRRISYEVLSPSSNSHRLDADPGNAIARDNFRASLSFPYDARLATPSAHLSYARRIRSAVFRQRANIVRVVVAVEDNRWRVLSSGRGWKLIGARDRENTLHIVSFESVGRYDDALLPSPKDAACANCAIVEYPRSASSSRSRANRSYRRSTGRRAEPSFERYRARSNNRYSVYPS